MAVWERPSKSQALIALFATLLLLACARAPVLGTPSPPPLTSSPTSPGLADTIPTSSPTPIPHTNPPPTLSPTPVAEPPPTPKDLGKWLAIPGVPVSPWSAALLPTGKVLLFQNGSSMALYDPKTQQFSPRFSAQTNLFCAGLAFLADGRLLSVGGHQGKDPQDHFLGVKSAEVFDPWQERWTRLPDMAGGERWYPTAITLSDGRLLVASGTHGGKMNETLEVLDPERMEWKVVAKKRLPSYPWAAVMPRGEVLFYGPQRLAELFHPNMGLFRPEGLKAIGRSGGTGVLLNARTGQVLALGGGNPTTKSVERFFPESKAWESTASMAYPRHHPNAVLLPNGSVLVVGGHHEEEDAKKEEEKEAKHGEPLPAELFDPQQGMWLEVEKAHFGHGYHSIALLLPDGSVLAGGPQRNLEVYLPWYFTQERPLLSDAPKTLTYGQTFPVLTPDAQEVAKVVAMRLSSVTHSLNTDQRYVELDFSPAAGGLAVKAPQSPTLSPPGYYLLFIVTERGVPSQGKFFRLPLP